MPGQHVVANSFQILSQILNADMIFKVIQGHW